MTHFETLDFGLEFQDSSDFTIPPFQLSMQVRFLSSSSLKNF